MAKPLTPEQNHCAGSPSSMKVSSSISTPSDHATPRPGDGSLEKRGEV
jgi:hypothetical protein